LEGCQHLAIANRDINRGQELISELQTISPRVELVSLADRAQLRRVLAQSTLVVNATSLGLEAGAASILDRSEIPPGIRIFDTIYGKGAEKLREETLQAGAKWSDGIGMLLYQGAEAFTLWTEKAAPVDEMRTGLEKEHI
jgi:shikimate dehydrogenase